jgi:uncharacterized C2H2 Zn-finger protein
MPSRPVRRSYYPCVVMQRPRTATAAETPWGGAAGDGMTAEELRWNIRQHLESTGVVRDMKSRLRATVLAQVARRTTATAARGAVDDTTGESTLVTRTADALIESYLRRVNRPYSHNVHCSEADVGEGGAAADAELRELLGFNTRRRTQTGADHGADASQDLLTVLVREALRHANDRRVGAALGQRDAGVQVHLAAQTLEERLALVDASFREQRATAQQESAVQWEQRLRDHEATIRRQCEADAEAALAKWKELELPKARAAEEERYRRLLQERVQRLTETQKAMQHQVDTEKFKAHQLMREAELRSQSVETEKAEMTRLTHVREHSLRVAHDELKQLRDQLGQLRQRAVELEQSSAASREDAHRMREALAAAEADARIAKANEERTRKAEAERLVRLESAHEATARNAAAGHRGSALAMGEVAAMHQQLILALEKVAHLEQEVHRRGPIVFVPTADAALLDEKSESPNRRQQPQRSQPQPSQAVRAAKPSAAGRDAAPLPDDHGSTSADALAASATLRRTVDSDKVLDVPDYLGLSVSAASRADASPSFHSALPGTAARDAARQAQPVRDPTRESVVLPMNAAVSLIAPARGRYEDTQTESDESSSAPDEPEHGITSRSPAPATSHPTAAASSLPVQAALVDDKSESPHRQPTSQPSENANDAANAAGIALAADQAAKREDCPLCGEVFSDATGMRRHFNEMHFGEAISGIDDFKKNYAKMPATMEAGLADGNLDESAADAVGPPLPAAQAAKQKECPLCSAALYSVSNMRRHFNATHFKEKTSLKANFTKNYEKMMKSANNDGAVSVAGSALTAAQAATRNDCPKCAKVFVKSANMRQHFNTMHFDGQTSSRTVDFKANYAKMTTALAAEQEATHEDCPICGQLLSDAPGMRRHFNEMHFGEATSGIDDFKKNYTKLMETPDDNLDESEDDDEDGPADVTGVALTVVQAAARKSCPLCDNVYSEASDMRRHFNEKHFGDKTRTARMAVFTKNYAAELDRKQREFKAQQAARQMAAETTVEAPPPVLTKDTDSEGSDVSMFGNNSDEDF